MPLGNIWSFPLKTMSYETTLHAMQELAGHIVDVTRGYKEFGHPIDINWALDPIYRKGAADCFRAVTLDRTDSSTVRTRHR